MTAIVSVLTMALVASLVVFGVAWVCRTDRDTQHEIDRDLESWWS